MALPTSCILTVGVYTPEGYKARENLKFSEDEEIVAQFVVWDSLTFAALQNVGIDFYLNGQPIGRTTTDIYGYAYKTIGKLPAGTYEVMAEWAGDWLHSPCICKVEISVEAVAPPPAQPPAQPTPIPNLLILGGIVAVIGVIVYLATKRKGEK